MMTTMTMLFLAAQGTAVHRERGKLRLRHFGGDSALRRIVQLGTAELPCHRTQARRPSQRGADSAVRSKVAGAETGRAGGAPAGRLRGPRGRGRPRRTPR